MMNKDLFGNEIVPDKDNKHGERIAEHQHKQLIQLHGAKGGKKCKECKFFMRHRYHGSIYFKCDKAKQSHSASTDWRANWQACGAFKNS